MNARLACAVAVAGLYFSAPLAAYAADYHVVYTGVITAGSDTDNIFGLSGSSSLTGLGLRADLTYSTSVAGAVRTTDTTSDEITGGLAFGTAPVISSAVFTIGSRSFSFIPAYYGDVYTSTTGGMGAEGYDILGNNFQTYIVPTGTGPASLQTAFTGTGTGDTGGAATQYSYLISGNDDIDFDAIGVSVAPVPELATWAMMMVGFGAMGSLMRRRNKLRRTTVSFA